MLRILCSIGLVTLLGCQGSSDIEFKDTVDVIEDSVNISDKPTVVIQDRTLDTIIERNNPDALDFSTNQLFIDTTRNSQFYDNIKNWEPHEFDNEGIAYYMEEIRQDYEPGLVSLGDFPREWVSLKLYNGEPLLYDPCNGMAARFRITATSVNFYAMESDVDAIHKVISRTHDEIELELRTIKHKSEDQTGTFSITKSKLPYIYILKYNYGDWGPGYLVTPLKDIHEFDMKVSACTTLIAQQIPFDKIQFNDFEK